MASTINSERMAKELYEMAKHLVAIGEEDKAAKLLAAAEVYNEMAEEEAQGE